MSRTPQDPNDPYPEPVRAPMRHCYFCGAPLGAYRDYDRLDTCGKAECERDARDCGQAERDEAHERLDRDMGWDR